VAKAGDKKIMVIVIILFAVALGVITALCYYKWVDNKAKKEKIVDIEKQIKVQEIIKESIAKLSQEKTQRVEAINQLTKILPTRTMASHQEFLYLLRGFAKSAGVTVKSLLPPRVMPNPELNIIRYKYIVLVDGTLKKIRLEITTYTYKP
jgi:predicted outer membrane lipoprotein